MRPGPLIRRMFGPYERGVAEAYRKFFFDLDGLAELMAAWVPQAQKILEVGCGEGAMTERIVRTYPTATVTAIDVSPRAGRLYRGETSTLTFSQESVQDVASREPASFDLVVLCDVIHHMPIEARRPLICAIDQAMAPRGSLLFKEWVISASPVHWLVYMSCRYLTGDRVAYCTIDGMKALVTEIFGPGTVRQLDTIRPRRNNVAVLVQRSQLPFSGDPGNR